MATPDDRHFAAARAALAAGKHLLVEKPAVLSLHELDELVKLAKSPGVLAKVVYHKLLDPDHKKLRTLVVDGELTHVNNGYCSLLEPKSISGGQFAEWIRGRNPGTYVAVHYIKLIDFTFGGRLQERSVHRPARPRRSGRRQYLGFGPVADGLRVSAIAARQPSTSIPAGSRPTIFPATSSKKCNSASTMECGTGTAANAAWNARSKGRTPLERKITLNNHYNGSFLEPWNERSQRGYGIEAVARFVQEVTTVEFGGPPSEPSPPGGDRRVGLQRSGRRPANGRRGAGHGSHPDQARRRGRRMPSSRSTARPADWSFTRRVRACPRYCTRRGFEPECETPRIGKRYGGCRRRYGK